MVAGPAQIRARFARRHMLASAARPNRARTPHSTGKSTWRRMVSNLELGYRDGSDLSWRGCESVSVQHELRNLLEPVAVVRDMLEDPDDIETVISAAARDAAID